MENDPLSSYGETAERCQASLCIFPISQRHREIAAGIPTSLSYGGDVGDTLVSPAGRPRTIKKALWILDTERRVPSKELNDHIDWIAVVVGEHGARFIATLPATGAQTVLRCVWWTPFRGGGPTIGPAQSRWLADCNLEVYINFQYYPSEDEDDAVTEEDPR